MQLLVEIGAQPLQLLGVAKLLGRDDLVELLGEGPVVGAALIGAPRRRRPARIGRLFGIGEIGFLLEFAGRRIGGIDLAVVHRVGRGLGFLHLARLAARVLLALVAFGVGVAFIDVVGRAVLILRLVVEARFIEHFERRQQFMHRMREGALIVDRSAEPVEIDARLLFDEGAPEIDDAPCVRRRLHAGQPLAHDHRERILDRRLGAGGDVGIAGALEAIVEHGVEIGGDPFHAARADGLDAGLFDGVEGRARGRESAASGGGALRCYGRQAAAPSNRHGRAGSPRRGRRCGAAARAAAPWRRRRSGSGSDAPAHRRLQGRASWRARACSRRRRV